MKRIVPYIVVMSLLLSLFAPIVHSKPISNDVYSYNQVQLVEFREDKQRNLGGNLSEIENANDYIEYGFQPLSNNWKNMVGGEAPAAFTTVSYELQDNVLLVNQDITQKIASRDQMIAGSTVQKLSPNYIVAEGGYIAMDVLDTAANQAEQDIEIGTVVVDESTGTAFKVVAPASFDGLPDSGEGAEGVDALREIAIAVDGTYSITTPQLHEVLKDFSLGGPGQDGETISLTRGNITGFAENVEESIVDSTGFEFLTLKDKYKGFNDLETPLIAFQFEDTQLDAVLEDGTQLKISLTGGIGIGDMSLNARYSGFDGYKIALTIAEESYLYMDMKVIGQKEVKIPIMGIGADLGVGSISGGLFIIVGVNGDVRIEIGAREYAKVSIGVKGGTKFYVPTSVKPLAGLESLKGDGDLAVSGVINGYLKFGPEMGLEIFGFDLVGASAFLGTGARIQTDGFMLDAELYGILEAGAHFAGKSFNLINQQPTILKKKVANTGSYTISFMEVFIVPSRVGGIIKEQSLDIETPDMPVEGIQYRILVVPATEPFDPNTPGDTDKPSIRKYPATGYHSTNAEGEFFYEDPTNAMLYNGDKVYLEINDGVETFISNPQSPTFEFGDMEMYSADYFNDFVTGQIMPIRIINWDATPADPEDQQYETSYYSNMPVTVSHNGTAVVLTDDRGYFDTRISVPDGTVNNMDVYPPSQGSFNTSFNISINHNYAVTTKYKSFAPTLTILYNRIVEEVEDSFNRIEEDGNIIDSVKYREYIWFMNPNGTRTFTDNELKINTWGISSVDDPNRGSSLNYYYDMPDLGGFNPVTVSEDVPDTLTPILDINGNTTGVSVLAREVTAQWVWQAHKNPVKITSPDKGDYTTEGGQFLITASGYAPFLFTLKDPPTGVELAMGTGDKVFMTIPSGMEEQVYTFTISAEENRNEALGMEDNQINLLGFGDQNDYYEGNDPSPVDEQLFTLTITEGATVTEEQPEEIVAPEETETPVETELPEVTTPPVEVEVPIEIDLPDVILIQPEIINLSDGFDFTMIEGEKDHSVLVKATGSTPIIWSLTSMYNEVPEGVEIGTSSGIMTFNSTVNAGTYDFYIEAKNEAGSDKEAFKLIVDEAIVAPTILDENHNYDFSKIDNGRDFEAQIKAKGDKPIEWSIKVTKGYEIPAGLIINDKTGLLTIGGEIGPGTYYFTINADNDGGSDTQACQLTVINDFRMAPVISNEEHGYAFVRIASDLDLYVQISATGSTPLTWSLVPSLDHRLPEDIIINPETGLLTFHEGMATGTYYFTIKVANDVGSDTQICSLLVKTGFSFSITDSGLSPMSMPLITEEKPTFFFIEEEEPQLVLLNEEMPAITSSITIQCDDDRDIYTNDRTFYNGAKYIRWEPSFSIGLDGASVVDYMYDSAPWCLKYHYKDSFIPYNTVDAIKELMEEIAGEIYKDSSDFGVFIGGPVTREELENDINNLIINPLEDHTTYLEYGSLLESMNAQKSGSFLVELDAYTGTLVPGNYFVGLMNHSDADLSFQQEGATITFSGSNVLAASENEMFNFGYTPEAVHESEILGQIGPGGENFTFAFSHHGELPGMATFAIDTDVNEGSIVNVYRFDSENNQFILIGENLLVGSEGMVTYNNNTMSEYLITTKTLSGAIITEVIKFQEEEKQNKGFPFGILVGLAVVLAIISLVVVTRKRRSKES